MNNSAPRMRFLAGAWPASQRPIQRLTMNISRASYRKAFYPIGFAILAFCWAVPACGQKHSARQQPAATQNVRAALRPNILLAIADDASFPHMSAYGTRWVSTPGFDRVAREGILFMNAYTPNAKCAPSRACILTGRNSWQLEEAANHSPDFPAKFKTFMEVLGANGYFVGHTLKGWAPGNPGEVNGQRRELTGKAWNRRTLTPPTSGISKNDYAANFRDFLEARPKGEPFCFWYGSVEPHRPYEYGSSLRQGKSGATVDRVPAYWPANDTVRTDLLDYALELEYFDQHLSKMLQILEEKGELDNTIVIVTADNGMPFPRAKGQAYEVSNHLPLAIMWKAGIRKAGRKVEDFVSFIDFAPTFLELTGLNAEQAGMQPTEGRSLTDLLFAGRGGVVNPQRDHVLIGKERHDVGRPHDQGYPIRGMVKGPYLYIKNYEPTRWPAGNPETGYLNTDGGATKTVVLNLRRSGQSNPYWQLCFGKRAAEELYDLQTDRDCLHNLALRPEHAALVQQMRTQMESELKAQQDPRMEGRGYVFENYLYSGEVKGFYERYMGGQPVQANWVNPTDFEPAPLPVESAAGEAPQPR